jgi:hypothetical protein
MRLVHHSGDLSIRFCVVALLGLLGRRPPVLRLTGERLEHSPPWGAVTNQLGLSPVVELPVGALGGGKPSESLRSIRAVDDVRERLLVGVVQSKLQADDLSAVGHVGPASTVRRLDRIAVLRRL